LLTIGAFPASKEVENEDEDDWGDRTAIVGYASRLSLSHHLTVAELSELGVKRISVGGALARVAFGSVLRAAREMQKQGTFGFVAEVMSKQDVSAIFGG